MRTYNTLMSETDPRIHIYKKIRLVIRHFIRADVQAAIEAVTLRWEIIDILVIGGPCSGAVYVHFLAAHTAFIPANQAAVRTCTHADVMPIMFAVRIKLIHHAVIGNLKRSRRKYVLPPFPKRCDGLRGRSARGKSSGKYKQRKNKGKGNYELKPFHGYHPIKKIKGEDAQSALPSAHHALCSMFSTKLMPLRMAMKPIIVGIITGSKPSTSERTPLSISDVTTLLSWVTAVVVSVCGQIPFQKILEWALAHGCGEWNRTTVFRCRA